MKITIFGSGYVGLVSAACWAEMGHEIVCMDVNPEKVRQLQSGIVPIYEPGLSDILNKHLQNQTLQYTDNVQMAVHHGQIQIIAVGTPAAPDGHADLQFVWQVAKNIGNYAKNDILIIDKSTVPVGTADQLENIVLHTFKQRSVDYCVDVVSNPEFLREGTALSDFLNPERIIIGAETEKAKEVMQKLYNSFEAPQIWMDRRSAELTKYAANAFLAMKISFINEIAVLAEHLGADIKSIAKGIGSDKRIGSEFLKAGCGYGGSCFPKDVKALAHIAKTIGSPSALIESIDTINERQKNLLFQKLKRYMGNTLQGKRVAIWGLAFKPNTDDIREAPSLTFIEACLGAGMQVQAFDPKAMNPVQKHLDFHPQFSVYADMYGALEGVDALAIFTEWSIFKEPDWLMVQNLMLGRLILDGRNLYNFNKMNHLGFHYQGIGQKNSLSDAVKSDTIAT